MEGKIWTTGPREGKSSKSCGAELLKWCILKWKRWDFREETAKRHSETEFLDIDGWKEMTERRAKDKDVGESEPGHYRMKSTQKLEVSCLSKKDVVVWSVHQNGEITSQLGKKKK